MITGIPLIGDNRTYQFGSTFFKALYSPLSPFISEPTLCRRAKEKRSVHFTDGSTEVQKDSGACRGWYPALEPSLPNIQNSPLPSASGPSPVAGPFLSGLSSVPNEVIDS